LATPKFYLAGEISLNLGILNLMPFPILDGGLILPAADRERAAPRHQHQREGAHLPGGLRGAGDAFFAFIIFNDVTKLPIFTHLKP
jgi:regulator of sigma E protease